MDRSPMRKPSGRRRVHDTRPEYRLDYQQVGANRFAGRLDGDCLVVVLAPDVARVFTTPESVNAVLRALIATMPKTRRRTRSGATSREAALNERA
jgi:hypothetical protein